MQQPKNSWGSGTSPERRKFPARGGGDRMKFASPIPKIGKLTHRSKFTRRAIRT